MLLAPKLGNQDVLPATARWYHGGKTSSNGLIRIKQITDAHATHGYEALRTPLLSRGDLI
jgi:hypothetical protein